MALHPVQGLNPGLSTSGTGVVSIGPAGSTYTSMEQSGRSLLKTYCDDFPNTDKSFVIPPMFDSVYTEVMPENSRGLNTKEKNKYDGARRNQDGERAEKGVYDMINEILRKEISRYPFLALFNVNMDNDNKMKVRKHALLAELNRMDFTNIKTSGEFDCIIVVKDLGTIHIEVKRTNNVSNIASAEGQLDSGVLFITNIMNAIKGSQCNLSSVRLIAIPCESSKSPTCKTPSGSIVAHSDECQNFTPIWSTVIKELKTSSVRNTFTSAEFTTFCNILMGWYCSEPVNYGSLKACKSNDSCLSLPNQINLIDGKVQHAEITSEEQKIKLELKKQAPISDIARTSPMDIFRNASDLSLLYLTPTQQSLYYHFPHAIVHGHGGTGKTILCLMKMMDLVRSGANRKALFVAPSPSHLYCRSILVKNKFNARIVEEVPSLQEANCDIVIITLNDFFNGVKIADASNFIGYDILVDDLQDYYTENLCNDSNLNKVGEFIQQHFIVASSNHLAWFCFDIVQSTSLEFDVNNLICFFPRLDPHKRAPPVVNLRHVLRNTSEIISTVEEGRNTALATTVNTKKIVKEFYKGHSITSSRVQCHRLNSSADPTSHEQFVLEMLRREVESLTKTKQALQLSQIAILVDNNSVLAEYKKSIDQMLLKHFNSSSQTIEESIISQQKDRVILDMAKNVASFESPCVTYIRTDNIGQVYRIISRARTRLTIIDVTEKPLQFESIDHIEWFDCKTGFYNVSQVVDSLHCKDLEQVKRFVSENPECLKLRRDGLTPFLLAAKLGCINTIKICIKYGANLDEKDLVSGQTSAILATRYGHLEALKYLLLKGVSVEEKDKDGKSVLHHAIEGRNVECVEWIIENYLYTLEKEVLNVEMLQTLRDQGINLEKEDSKGNTILYYAALDKQVECVKWIIKNYPKSAYIFKNSFIIHEMAFSGNLEMLEVLHDSGVCLDEVDNNGNTIIDYAVIGRQKECLHWALQNYPQLVDASNNKTSILRHLAITGNIEILEILRDQGVSLEDVDSNGNTILHHAVSNRKYDCFVWILQNYPQLVEATKYKNSSLLLEVASLDDLEMLNMLCNHEEASKGLKYQKSLSHKAAISHSTEELRILIENEIKSDSCEAEETSLFIEKVHGDVTVFRNNGLVFKDTYSTVYLPLPWLYRGFKVYFEIEVVENEFTADLFYIGLINSRYLPPENRRDKGVAYWDRWLTKVGVKRYTVGVAIDIMNCQILYVYASKSSKPITFSRLDDSLGLLPIVCGSDITLQLNFGEREFKYSPPDSTYKSVEELTKGTNILHVAARHNQADCCKDIIDTYPHLLNKTSGRGTTLHECASTGSFDSLQVLLDAGADMTITNIFGLTALDMAKINDQPECQKELERRLRNTILDYAAIGGQEECFKWVLQNYPQLFDNMLKEGKRSTLHQVAKNGHFEILEILRNEGVNLEQADSEGNTILHHAVSERKYDCFVWILQNYPQLVETTKYKNSSILLEVASLEDYEMLNMLCNHEEASKEIKYQKSLLHKAAISHSTKELRILIKNEIKSNSCEAEETSPFLEKVDGNVTVFRDNGLVFKDICSTVYLPLAWLYRGCNVYFEIEVVENRFTYNFFSIGLINSHFLPPENRRDRGVVYWNTWLNKVGVKRYTVGVAIDIMNCQILYVYASKSTKPITFSRLDDGLGLLPAVYGQDTTLQLNFGAQEFKYSPPDSTYKSVEELTEGTNILHVAARNNQADCCKYVVDNYPHLLNKTSGRGTPLHECASTGSFDSLQVLLDAGADMTITNIFGLTALDMAKINDQPECQKELERRLNVGNKSLLSRLRQNFRKK